MLHQQVRPIAFRCECCMGRVTVRTEVRDGELVCPRCGKTCPILDGVVVLGEPPEMDTYPDQAYALLARVESKHFWFKQRDRLIVSTLREALGPLGGSRCVKLDAGRASSWPRSSALACSHAAWTCIFAGCASRANAPFVVQQRNLPFGSQFDVVMLCDVIEHTSDDIGLGREGSNALDPAGLVLVPVPPRPRLRTAIDEAAGHKRRYTRDTLPAR
jgi:uncharacterized protein YbaR (Trm112 family)